MVKRVAIRADGEFFSHEAVKAAVALTFSFIIANRASKPVFDDSRWYQVSPKDKITNILHRISQGSRAESQERQNVSGVRFV